MAGQIPLPSAGDDLLHGWKAIAAHFGKSVRTVQRWESELGLPTHRVATKDGQTAYAYRSELRAWLESRDRSPDALDADALGATEGPDAVANVVDAREGRADTPLAALRLSRATKLTLAVIALCAALAGAITMYLWNRLEVGAPASLVFAGRRLEARDAQGHLVWVHDFDTDVMRPDEGIQLQRFPIDQQRFPLPSLEGGGDTVARVDISDDGHLASLVAVRFGTNPTAPERPDALFAFADDGTVLWQVPGHLSLACAGKSFPDAWSLTGLAVSKGAGKKRIWAAFVHGYDWPSFVLEISPAGESRLLYLQTGWITSLAEWQTAAGWRLVAGGVMHDDDRPSVTIVDPDGPASMSPHADPRFDCVGAPTGRPDRVILFPNFDLVPATGNAYAMVQTLKSVEADLLAGIDRDLTLATVNRAGDVTDLVFSDRYWFRHGALESLHLLKHSADECPLRRDPGTIRTWAAGSWSEYPIRQVSTSNRSRR